ncbi:hypothetical protein [Holophaga foetida]|uniref:hypothetical protein n=1 Tax=Holophaga foetida TaxID=35839 RepID=UPI00024745F8|nr:hypothetical protein [Holophaga foetida]
MDRSLSLPEAPGARASRHCGIWALVLVIIFFPAAVILGIIAIVQNNKAKTLARNAPDTYRAPSSAGMIMGILSLVAIPVFLFLAGVFAAIAIPAFIGQRNRAQDRVALTHLSTGTGVLVNQFEMGMVQGKLDQDLHKDLETQLRETGAPLKNPWNVTGPAFEYSIAIVNGLDEDGLREVAQSQASNLGQVVFVVQFPSRPGESQQAGFLAGAVRTRMPVDGSTVTTRVTPLN